MYVHACVFGVAHQVLCLLMCLPIALAGTMAVPSEEPVVLLYQRFHKWVCLCLSLPITTDMLRRIRQLTQQIFSSMVLHFPDRITPKWHYFCHYPLLVTRYVTRNNVWCFSARRLSVFFYADLDRRGFTGRWRWSQQTEALSFLPPLWETIELWRAGRWK